MNTDSKTVQGTGRRNQHQLELEIENMGGHLNAYTSVRTGLSPNNDNLLTEISARKYSLLRQIVQQRRTQNRRHPL